MPRQFGDRETDQAVLDLYIKCGRVKAKAAKVFGTSRQSFATRLNSISNRWGIDVEVDDTIEIIEEQPIEFEMPAGSLEEAWPWPAGDQGDRRRG
jgi:hypothetical protein